MTNQLITATSPYLKLHASNPVEWYPWGERALSEAKAQNKPILLSIGYAACHWCHVMAHESFEDSETAILMNKYFINIKVDREERPDLDKIYQLSAQLLTRQVGGWPLTIFLMPQTLLPFFAGTYFPKTRLGQVPSFQEVLLYIQHIYTHNQTELQAQSISFQSILNELEAQSKLHTTILDNTPITRGRRLLESSLDKQYGGLGSAPKFPMTPALEFLLLNEGKNASDTLLKTFHAITQRGLYDHLGGGFFRYCVDDKWQIPHFEKMLYDNALLSYVCLQAEETLQQSYLSEHIIQTVDWMIREMAAEQGGFYATLSADTEGEEGKYYLWQKEEIAQLFQPDQYEIIADYFGLNRPPNLKQSWHLYKHITLNELSEKHHMSIGQTVELIAGIKDKMLSERSLRIKPMRDEKIITAWNGLAIKALAAIGLRYNKLEYISAAQKAVDFIVRTLWVDNKLYSVYAQGQISNTATLDDYVFLIEGLFYLLQAQWRNKDFEFMMQLIPLALGLFEDKEAGGFYFTPSHQEQLIYRLKQYADEAIPSSNAVFATVLQFLGFFLADESLLQSAQKCLSNAFSTLSTHPDFYSSFLTSLIYFFDKPQFIIIRGEGEQLQLWRQTCIKYFSPQRFFFFVDSNVILPAPLHAKMSAVGECVAYFCIGFECLSPIKNLVELENELQRQPKSS